MSVTREGRPECWSWGRGLYWISSRELTRELESGDEAGKARSRVLRVPITGDLPSVLDGEYGVEKRLMGKSRREGSKPRLGDESKLLEPDRAIQNQGRCCERRLVLLRRRVLAAELRRRPLLTLLLPVQARLTVPRALQRIANVEA